MKSKENAIVSVIINNDSYDMELPLFISIEELKKKLKDTINGLGIEIGDFNLTTNNGTLINEFCLAHYGIWEGGVIKVA